MGCRSPRRGRTRFHLAAAWVVGTRPTAAADPDTDRTTARERRRTDAEIELAGGTSRRPTRRNRMLDPAAHTGRIDELHPVAPVDHHRPATRHRNRHALRHGYSRPRVAPSKSAWRSASTRLATPTGPPLSNRRAPGGTRRSRDRSARVGSGSAWPQATRPAASPSRPAAPE